MGAVVDEPGDTFELEPEEERAAPKVDLPAARSIPGPAVPLPSHDEEPATQTVAERKGTAVDSTPDALPPPANWPREMFAFPLRNPGAAFFAGIGGTFVLADWLGTVPELYFPARVLIVLTWICALRVQAKVIGQSAAGQDRPVRWHDALQLDTRDLSPLSRFLAVYVSCFVLPQALLLWLDTSAGVWIALLLSPVLAVVMLGWALGDPSLKWPWNALEWLARRPLEFVVGAAGWWALWYGQLAVDASAAPWRFALSPLVRFASLYLLLVSARAVGVAGRSWTPWGYQAAEPARP